jgi:hypothetical protein
MKANSWFYGSFENGLSCLRERSVAYRTVKDRGFSWPHTSVVTARENQKETMASGNEMVHSFHLHTETNVTYLLYN